MELLTPNAGLTVSAIIALLIFFAKTVFDYWTERQRQKHLVKALTAYMDHMMLELEDTWIDVDKIRKRVNETAEFTPYILYDSDPGFDIQTICREYSFLRVEAIKSVVGYITSLHYLQNSCEQLRTEYVRSFTSERKIQMVEEISETVAEVISKSRKARDALAA